MISILNGHSLKVKDQLNPESMSLQLSERQRTATMVIGPGAPAVNVGDWLRDESGPGEGTVWRVKTVDRQFDTDTRTVSLEHVVMALRDMILFGEVTPATIAGNKKAKTVTVTQAARYVLAQSQDWTLGSCDFTDSNPYSFNGDDLFSALETISRSVSGCRWTYTLTSYPFKLNLRKAATEVSTEMRMERNIRTLKRTIDRSRMYTRFYPIGKNNLHIKGNYVSKNENLYGVICKTETDQSLDTEAKLKAWALERLNAHCEPSVTVSISGADLSAVTGEPMDSFQIGTLCRVPLPEFGTTITERVTKLSWSDKISDPYSVTVTLANDEEDVASIVNSLASSAARSGRAGAKKAEEDHAWIEDTEDHVSLVAEAVAGPGAGSDWSRVSEITVDGKGIHQRVQKTEKDIVTESGRIDVTEKNITAEVKNRKNADSELSGRIDVTATDITLEVKRAKKAEADLSGKIIVEAGKTSMVVELKDNRKLKSYTSRSAFPEKGDAKYLYLDVSQVQYYEWRDDNKYHKIAKPEEVIKAGDITMAINDAGETEAHINAEKIYIGGEKSTTVIAGKCALSDVTADYINGKIATLATLTTQSIAATGTISAGTLNGDTIRFRHSSGAGYTYTDLKTAFVSSLSLTKSGNTYTLTSYDANATATEIGTFSRAISSFTVTGVSGGKIKVTAQPQDQNKQVKVSISGPNSITSNGNKTYKVMYEDENGDDQEVPGASVTVNVNVSTTHSPTVNSFDSTGISKSASGASSYISGKTKANSGVLSSGRYYSFQVKCSTGTKNYYIET